MIRQDGLGRFKVYTPDGSKLVGNHRSKDAAQRQERALKAAETRRAKAQAKSPKSGK